MEEKIQEILKKGPLSNRELRAELKLKGAGYDAKLDRTLQKMRKEGKIKVEKNRWFGSSLSVCSSCNGKGWVKK